MGISELSWETENLEESMAHDKRSVNISYYRSYLESLKTWKIIGNFSPSYVKLVSLTYIQKVWAIGVGACS